MLSALQVGLSCGLADDSVDGFSAFFDFGPHGVKADGWVDVEFVQHFECLVESFAAFDILGEHGGLVVDGEVDAFWYPGVSVLLSE